jgi:predicted glycoside hydrolase/deacetylase ChbG (UPF0249 family)
MLIINADDWGINKDSTNKSLDCFKNKRITSATAMMFMSDSERAADLALESELDVGLHLNLDTRFERSFFKSKLNKYHEKISSFLNKNKYNQIVYNPFLKNAFEYVFKKQYEEYVRLYNKPPSHIDGHHHMHLSINMIIDKIIPNGTKIRRNFSFKTSEKNAVNRLYRRLIDYYIMKRYVTTDYFFDIFPLNIIRLKKIFKLSINEKVEIMVHPENLMQYTFLMKDEFMKMICNLNTVSYESI